jgi:hypothetical protein
LKFNKSFDEPDANAMIRLNCEEQPDGKTWKFIKAGKIKEATAKMQETKKAETSFSKKLLTRDEEIIRAAEQNTTHDLQTLWSYVENACGKQRSCKIGPTVVAEVDFPGEVCIAWQAAVWKKNARMIEYLLTKHRVHIDVSKPLTGQQQVTPLHVAAGHGHNIIVALLLQSKQQSDAEEVALWNIPDIHGNTPLHAAVFKRKMDVAITLIDAGADINATNNAGTTPLHAAASNVDMSMLQLLRTKGALPHRDNNNKRPRDLLDARIAKKTKPTPQEQCMVREVCQWWPQE